MEHGRTPRGAALSAALALALGLGGAAAASASANAAAAGGALAADEVSDVTWGVQPSSENGPDGRAALEHSVEPGTVISDWVTVTNHSAGAADFRVYASDATTDYDTASYTLIGAEQASTDAGAWTSVGGGPAECPDTNNEAEQTCARDLGVRISLGAGESKTLPVVITVPADATPGDHAAGVVAAFEQEAAEADGTLILLEQRVGTRVYLRVDGPLQAAVGVSGVTASYEGTLNPFGRGAATIGFDVANTGNVRLSGAPQVRLTGPFGIHLGSAQLEPVANLLPGGKGHVEATLPKVWPLFYLGAKVTVAPQGGDGGINEIELGLTPVTASAATWAVPWALLGLLALLGGGGSLFAWQRRRSRRELAAELAAYTEAVLAGTAGGRP